ncbi:MAG TPA: hypothetical protein VHA82_10550 [Ramlibacter sp.]|uniref:hypothetical protein n=1 Tax=Ramlibacter sp. TaxID=1917967 RepID=UPI002C34D650|nr:hypothetical protein [Ramlibacter sp.]HVZ44237.1 hypothetical protein [Ramlibacter sp.]
MALRDKPDDDYSLVSQNVASAEADALQAEREEQTAYEHFDSVRRALGENGRAHEATLHPEFHRWMNSRENTDGAWGRWALAVDALHDSEAEAPPSQ